MLRVQTPTAVECIPQCCGVRDHPVVRRSSYKAVEPTGEKQESTEVTAARRAQRLATSLKKRHTHLTGARLK